MFFSFMVIGLIRMFFVLWGDYIKVLIFIEILSLVFLSVILFALKLDYISLNYFFSVLIFLVCESRLGFLLFIFYIRIEAELVKKLILVQF
jgi:hypothetical protein